MTHQCPKCELRFSWHTELEDHCRTEHPQFHHDYPASVHHDASPSRVRVAAAKPVPSHAASESERTVEILNTWWGER
jgi:hypothetical protein